jgi:hypothetical protein
MRAILSRETLLVLLTVTWAGGIFGMWRVASDNADDIRRNELALTFVQEQAAWENLRVERQTCEINVRGRASVRRAFLGIYELLDRVSETAPQWTTEARALLDETHPMLDLADCPILPPPPTRPEIP